MKQTYFIDSENVNDLWVNLLDTTPEDAELLVFYTKNSPYMSYACLRRLKESERTITFIKCYEGTNALDFQLVTELGYRLKETSESDEPYEMIVVSNDNGFTAAVNYWVDRGMKVRRINGQACSSLNIATSSVTTAQVPEQEMMANAIPTPLSMTIPEGNASAEAKEVAPQETSVEEPVVCESGQDFPKEDVDVVIRCLGKKNLAELYNALVAIFGEKGKDYYALVKPKSYKVEPQAWKLKEKLYKYAAVVFANAQVDMPENFGKFLQDSREKMKNLNSFRAACTKQFGKEQGAIYYGIVKHHVKWIAAMN